MDVEKNPEKRVKTPLTRDELRRRKRELVIGISILVLIAVLTFIENRLINFGTHIPVSNTILMFILININMLLLILLIFLVFRNLVKLFYERKLKILGSKLKARLVIAFIALSLLPTIVLFFFSINFITNSIEFWFNVPVEQALDNSITVGRKFYTYAQKKHRFLLERVSYQIVKKDLVNPDNLKALNHYIQIVQKEFDLDAVEIYTSNLGRLTYAHSLGAEDVTNHPMPAEEFQKEPIKDRVRTISKVVENGEMVRTIGAVPFDAPYAEAKAYVVLAMMIPPDLSSNMAAISKGFEEYQQVKLMKKPIQITYYISLSIVALLVVFCAVWFGFYLAKTITIPIMKLADGTKLVADGDLSFTIDSAADDEIGVLVDSFNRMTEELRINREQLEKSSKQLKDRNEEIDRRRMYMETVLKNVSAGVITLDAKGNVTTLNTSAEKMLSLHAEDVLNKSYKNLLLEPHLKLAGKILTELSESMGSAAEIPLRLSINGTPKSFLTYVNELKDDKGRHLGIVVVFDDLTELEKAQRMSAWREVARRIAHEVKNPLTPISLSAQRIMRRYSERIDEPVFDECTRMIIDHVELIRNLVNEFSAFARFPTADPKPCELPPIIDETLALYREGHPDINFEIIVDDEIPTMNLDRGQIKQAIINLVENAVASVKNNGSISISMAYDAILKLVRMEVADNGTGIKDEDKIRLFEPNFSTKTAGMGLGLTIVNTIVTDHNGMIRVQDNHPKGAKFIIELPV